MRKITEEIKTGKSFKVISDTMEKMLNKKLKYIDISARQGITLIWLNEEETKELPIKSIEKMSSTSQPTTLGIINRLEQKNLVKTYLSQQRTKIVQITEDGQAHVQIIEKHIDEVDKQLFDGFNQDEKDLFLQFLQRAEDNLLNR